MNIYFEKKFFSFNLVSVIQTSKSDWLVKKGWIIKLDNFNKSGFGEIAPLNAKDLAICHKQIAQIPNFINSNRIFKQITNFHPCIQSGFYSAFAEMEGKFTFKEINNFKEINQTVILVNSKTILEELKLLKKNKSLKNKEFTIKWKVAVQNNIIEEKLLENILNILSERIKIRIDANGAWQRETANRWAEILKDNKNLEWLEQPLSAEDIDGARELNQKIPIALDETLLKYPEVINKWEGWQIRRPSQEKNPLLLLESLEKKKNYLSISSSFETGIGRRLLLHFANIQMLSNTPTLPGLALSKMPKTLLFAEDPNTIWESI
tara:strand:- start:152 stop:1114 length:963 start_codon:yes stop_codon:yes gene_type:complete